VRAMLAGDFYSSTGVVLDRIEAGECGLRVRVAAEAGVRYRIRFIGAGIVLQESEGPDATYEYGGDELYVRALLVSDRLHPAPVGQGGPRTAWTQPVRGRRP